MRQQGQEPHHASSAAKGASCAGHPPTFRDVQKGRSKSHIEEVSQYAKSYPMCNLGRPFCTSAQRPHGRRQAPGVEKRPARAATAARPQGVRLAGGRERPWPAPGQRSRGPRTGRLPGGAWTGLRPPVLGQAMRSDFSTWARYQCMKRSKGFRRARPNRAAGTRKSSRPPSCSQ